jgi:hypothetical protein
MTPEVWLQEEIADPKMQRRKNSKQRFFMAE